MDSPFVLVDLLHDLGVNLLNSFPDLSVEVLDLLGSFLGLPTKLGWIGEWNEV